MVIMIFDIYSAIHLYNSKGTLQLLLLYDIRASRFSYPKVATSILVPRATRLNL